MSLYIYFTVRKKQNKIIYKKKYSIKPDIILNTVAKKHGVGKVSSNIIDLKTVGFIRAQSLHVCNVTQVTVAWPGGGDVLNPGL